MIGGAAPNIEKTAESAAWASPLATGDHPEVNPEWIEWLDSLEVEDASARIRELDEDILAGDQDLSQLLFYKMVTMYGVAFRLKNSGDDDNAYRAIFVASALVDLARDGRFGVANWLSRPEIQMIAKSRVEFAIDAGIEEEFGPACGSAFRQVAPDVLLADSYKTRRAYEDPNFAHAFERARQEWQIQQTSTMSALFKLTDPQRVSLPITSATGRPYVDRLTGRRPYIVFRSNISELSRELPNIKVFHRKWGHVVDVVFLTTDKVEDESEGRVLRQLPEQIVVLYADPTWERQNEAFSMLKMHIVDREGYLRFSEKFNWTSHGVVGQGYTDEAAITAFFSLFP